MNELATFAKGVWPGDLESLEQSLIVFQRENGNRRYSPCDFAFYIAFDYSYILKPDGQKDFQCSLPTNRTWPIACDYDRTVLKGGPEDGDFQGWPYGEVQARKGPSGLIVELRHGKAYASVFREYFAHLVAVLQQDGLTCGVTERVRELAESEPWEAIAEGWEREAVRLWWQGFDKGQIAEKLDKRAKTVENRFSQLRKDYGVEVVPYRKDLERLKLESRE